MWSGLWSGVVTHQAGLLAALAQTWHGPAARDPATRDPATRDPAASNPAATSCQTASPQPRPHVTPSAHAIVANLPGEPRMLDMLRAGLREADALDAAVSFVRCSGTGLLIDDIRAFGARGGRLRLLASTYLGVTQPDALEAVAGLPGVTCRLHVSSFATREYAAGFHAKLYQFHGRAPACWVGSSNLSKAGLTTSVEANLLHVDPPALDAGARLFERLWRARTVVDLTGEALAAYREALRRVAQQSPLGPLPADLPSGLVELPEPELAHVLDAQLVAAQDLAAQGHAERGHAERGQSGAALRPNEAQREALERLAALRAAGERRAVVVAATGVGKTVLAALDARAAGARRIVFVSHRKEHLAQARRAFEHVLGPDRRYEVVMDGARSTGADCTFVTIQSARSLPERLPIDYLVVDEFHHAAAPSYRALLERRDPGFLLGLTATPERQDGHDVLRLCDYNVAYEVRLTEAIDRGWLLPFHYYAAADEAVSYDRIPWRSGRFDPTALENALSVEARVDAVLRHAFERGFDGVQRRAVGFCAGIRHAEFMADALRRRGHEAVHLTGTDSLAEREAAYARLASPTDPLSWIFVADILNEGVDIPAINTLLMLRPTESATVFIQQLGRGLRLYPDCEVLTVLDFVGHHRAVWTALQALTSRDRAVDGDATPQDLLLAAPRHCEIVLDRQTERILEKVTAQERRPRERWLDVYAQLRRRDPRPMPHHLLELSRGVDFGQLRSAHGSWVRLRRAAKDALPWEEALDDDAPLARFLGRLERSLNASRVFAYALLWGLVAEPADPAAGYERFFRRFPRWRVEHGELAKNGAWATVAKHLGELLRGPEGAQRLDPAVFGPLPPEELLVEVEGRLRLWLDADYRARHGGVLRTPAQLVLHRRYTRPVIVNHFGVQFDPAKHNTGLLRLDQEHDDASLHSVIVTKLDTSGAAQQHQYDNALLDRRTFRWSSQNRQRRDNPAGRLVLDHAQTGRTLHLFVQARSHTGAFYLGPVDVIDAQGDAPIQVTFRLRTPVPPEVAAELGVNLPD
mgnify:CR=1 FL=1